jgi:hypothetical protein
MADVDRARDAKERLKIAKQAIKTKMGTAKQQKVYSNNARTKQPIATECLLQPFVLILVESRGYLNRKQLLNFRRGKSIR